MNFTDLSTGILIFLGAVVMLFSAIATARVVKLLKGNEYAKDWRLLRIFMFVFLGGYLAAAGLVIGGQRAIVLVLTGVVFLFGAVFVNIVVRLGYRSMSSLQAFNERLEEQVEERTQEIRQQAGKLEENNTELQGLYEALESRRNELEIAVTDRTKELEQKHQIATRTNEFFRFTLDTMTETLSRGATEEETLNYIAQVREQFDKQQIPPTPTSTVS